MADRPRGRARGRGRSSANGQAPEPARRPGTHAQGPPPPQPAAVSGVSNISWMYMYWVMIIEPCNSLSASKDLNQDFESLYQSKLDVSELI